MRYCKAVCGFLMLIFAGGCGIKPTVFLHPQFNFSFIERVAVVPFENLSSDQGAGARVTQIFVTELFSYEAFNIVEPGETGRVLEPYSIVRTSALTNEQIESIGRQLKVQALFLGTVTESSSQRSAGSNSNTVTLTVRLVETETGETVWSATHSEGGRGFWSAVFGTDSRSYSEVTRRCVRRIIDTLID